MKQIVINADDLGISISTNRAIHHAVRDGILTSASLMANMPAFEHALEHIVCQNRNLGMGIHLCLTSGRPVLNRSRVPLLVGEDGCFRNGFLRLLGLLRSRQRTNAICQIVEEWEAQLDKLQAAGVEIDHIDSHRHVHMIPELFQIVVRMARQLPGVVVRNPRERFSGTVHAARGRRRYLLGVRVLKALVLARCEKINRDLLASVPTARRFHGILTGGIMAAGTLTDIIRSVEGGITEVVTHPGLPSCLEPSLFCTRSDRRFLQSRFREMELEALLASSVQRAVEENGVSLARFSDIPRDVAGTDPLQLPSL